MLGDKDTIATIAVKDVKVAGKFYEGTLGLKQLPATPGVLSYRSGNSTVLVYESQYARTNKATAATWAVGEDVEGVVQTLKDRASFSNGMTLLGPLERAMYMCRET